MFECQDLSDGRRSKFISITVVFYFTDNQIDITQQQSTIRNVFNHAESSANAETKQMKAKNNNNNMKQEREKEIRKRKINSWHIPLY